MQPKGEVMRGITVCVALTAFGALLLAAAPARAIVPLSAANDFVFSEINVAANTTASFVICNSGGIGCGAGTGETNFSRVLQVAALSDTAYVTTGRPFNQGIDLEVEAGGTLGASFNAAP